MGNSLVSEYLPGFQYDFWSTTGVAFATAWLCLITYTIYKCLMEKSWCCDAENQRAINETNSRRRLRFEEVAKRVANQDEQIRDEILSLSLFDLRDALQAGDYKALQVLNAYAWKALQVNEKLNCICEFQIESFELAQRLDTEYAGSDAKPPLFGIPFSVKNNFQLKGYDATMGLAQLLNQPAAADCTFVVQLREQGAIPFVSTNVPQTLLSFMCSNPIYGTTLNPYNTLRTPGGSSGGEACLLAAGGTPFAVGSDIGGSVRIPAAFCGLTSLKPTQDRFIVEHVSSSLPGRSRLGLSYGFFTKSVDEQAFLSSLVWGTDDYRRLIVRHAASLPYQPNVVESTRTDRLRIGYYADDGFLKCTPGCSRVVLETVERLRAAGHELVRFHVPEPQKVASTLFRAILCDGGAYFLRLWRHDVIDEYMKEFARLLKVPNFLRSIAGIVLKPISPQMAIMARAYVATPEDVRRTNAELDGYCMQFLNMWKELQLDALVCPAFSVPALPHDQPSRLSACAFATALYNLLDLPAGIVPVDTVTKQDDADLADENVWPTGYNLFYKMMRSGAKDSVGLPLAVQVVTRPFEEEKCLGVMSIVESLWREDGKAVAKGE